MKNPITAPNTRPITSMSAMTTTGSQPSLRSTAEATVVSATTPLTDRSMPPEMMTSPSPTTRMSRKGVVMNRLRKACPSRMAGYRIMPPTNASANSAIVAPSGKNFRLFARRRLNDCITQPPASARCVPRLS